MPCNSQDTSCLSRLSCQPILQYGLQDVFSNGVRWQADESLDSESICGSAITHINPLMHALSCGCLLTSIGFSLGRESRSRSNLHSGQFVSHLFPVKLLFKKYENDFISRRGQRKVKTVTQNSSRTFEYP